MILFLLFGRLWGWLPRLVILLVLVVIGYTCVNGDLPGFSCRAPWTLDRSPEAVEERIEDAEERYIRDDEGKIIGIKAREAR